LQGWSSSTSATLPDPSLYNAINLGQTGGVITVGMNARNGVSIPYNRFNIALTTTIYLSASATFSGTATACGSINARRMR